MSLDDVDIYSLPSLLSIRKFKSAEDNHTFVDGMTFEKVLELHNEIIGKKTGNKSLTISSDIDKARLLVDLLSIKRAKSYF